MTATLEEIHRDPASLDRAIARREPLDIVAASEVTATLTPKAAPAPPKRRHLVTELPDFAARKARLGDTSLTPEVDAEFFRLIRGE